jgi:hypothetical protein
VASLGESLASCDMEAARMTHAWIGEMLGCSATAAQLAPVATLTGAGK